jgi:hypothetical protein
MTLRSGTPGHCGPSILKMSEHGCCVKGGGPRAV